MKQYITLLAKSGNELNLIRDNELKNACSSVAAIEALDASFKYAVISQPPLSTSGLVEYQRVISKAYTR